MNTLTVLAIGAHPDDVELTCGATLLLLKQHGVKIGVMDCTRGEMGTRGNARLRLKESKNAAQVLGLNFRENLKLPDGDLSVNHSGLKKTVIQMRKWRPHLILAPYSKDRHPDHVACHALVKKAAWVSGLQKFETGQPPHRPPHVWYYTGRTHLVPAFIIDVSQTFAQSLKAIQCYQSQLYQSGQKTDLTNIGRKDFLDEWEARARYWGSLIQTSYGQAFMTDHPLGIKDPLSLIK